MKEVIITVLFFSTIIAASINAWAIQAELIKMDQIDKNI